MCRVGETERHRSLDASGAQAQVGGERGAMLSLSPPGPPLVSWACPKAATARFAKLCSQDFRPPVHPRLASAQATSPRAQRESTFSPHPSAARGWPPTPSRSLLPSRWPSRGDGAPWLMWEGHAPQRTACFMKGQGRRRDSPKAPGFAVTTRHVCARRGTRVTGTVDRPGVRCFLLC